MRRRRQGAVVCLVVFAAALLVACGSSEDAFNRVQMGMASKEVKAIMGEPQSLTTVMGTGQWVYEDRYVIQFVGDKVVGTIKK